MRGIKLASNPTWLAVVAVALFDDRGRLLLQQRPPGKRHAGLWEFPGGKVEADENPRVALCRELHEELDLVIDPADLEPALLSDEGAAGPIVLMLYTCRRWRGPIIGRDGQDWGWYELEAASGLPMPPLDLHLVRRVGQPAIAKP